jgi:hypothetical protein
VRLLGFLRGSAEVLTAGRERNKGVRVGCCWIWDGRKILFGELEGRESHPLMFVGQNYLTAVRGDVAWRCGAFCTVLSALLFALQQRLRGCVLSHHGLALGLIDDRITLELLDSVVDGLIPFRPRQPWNPDCVTLLFAM